MTPSFALRVLVCIVSAWSSVASHDTTASLDWMRMLETNETSNETSPERGFVEIGIFPASSPVAYVPDNQTTGDNQTLVWAYSMVSSPPVLFVNAGNETEGSLNLVAYALGSNETGNETEGENVFVYSMVSVNPPFVTSNETSGENQTFMLAYSTSSYNPPVLYMRTNLGNETESLNSTEGWIPQVYSMVSANPPYFKSNETEGENGTLVWAYSAFPVNYVALMSTGGENGTISYNPNETIGLILNNPQPYLFAGGPGENENGTIMYMMGSGSGENENGTIVYMVSANPPVVNSNETSGQNNEIPQIVYANPPVEKPKGGNETEGEGEVKPVENPKGGNETEGEGEVKPVETPKGGNETEGEGEVKPVETPKGGNETEGVGEVKPVKKPEGGNETEGGGEVMPNRTSSIGIQPNFRGEKPQEHSKGKPAWFETIKQMFPSPDLKVCGKRKNVIPENGSPCSKKKSKTCYFGNQTCPTLASYPETKCLCIGSRTNKTWTCTPLACP